MKIRTSNRHPARRNENGFAVIVILILLGIMLLFITANTMTVNWLGKQVKLDDQRQIKRLAMAATNQLPTAQSVTNQPASK